jgi:hypothetical protein
MVDLNLGEPKQLRKTNGEKQKKQVNQPKKTTIDFRKTRKKTGNLPRNPIKIGEERPTFTALSVTRKSSCWSPVTSTEGAEWKLDNGMVFVILIGLRNGSNGTGLNILV